MRNLLLDELLGRVCNKHHEVRQSTIRLACMWDICAAGDGQCWLRLQACFPTEACEAQQHGPEAKRLHQKPKAATITPNTSKSVKNLATPDAPCFSSPARQHADQNTPKITLTTMACVLLYTMAASQAQTRVDRTVWHAHPICVWDDVLDVDALILVDEAAVRVRLFVRPGLQRLQGNLAYVRPKPSRLLFDMSREVTTRYVGHGRTTAVAGAKSKCPVSNQQDTSKPMEGIKSVMTACGMALSSAHRALAGLNVRDGHAVVAAPLEAELALDVGLRAVARADRVVRREVVAVEAHRVRLAPLHRDVAPQQALLRQRRRPGVVVPRLLALLRRHRPCFSSNGHCAKGSISTAVEAQPLHQRTHGCLGILRVQVRLFWTEVPMQPT